MNYLEIAEHYNSCFEKHGDNNLGVDWPNYKDTLTRHKVMFEVTRFGNQTPKKPISLLDFGCGLGHFYEWIRNEKIEVNYSGLDINENFYNLCKNKFPNLEFFHKDILKDEILPNYDYIICNGVFTEKRNLTQDEMFDFLKKTISVLWKKTDVGISFNVMSKLVDWERNELFHLSIDDLGKFITQNLSRNFIIRNDYKLYEYTVYVYK
jgi:SAM-dependent methyltransferase